jgi:hypothetical protein
VTSQHATPGGNPALIYLNTVEAEDEQERVRQLEAERDSLRERLELIAINAQLWHHDDEAKQRALSVIAAWARGAELPPSLVASLRRERVTGERATPPPFDTPQVGTAPCPFCGAPAVALIERASVKIVCDVCLGESWGTADTSDE